MRSKGCFACHEGRASPADDGEALADVNEKMDRLCLAVCGDKEVDAADAIGDLLLSVTAFPKKLGIDAEEALYRFDREV